MNSDCGFHLGNGFVSQALPLPQNYFVYSLRYKRKSCIFFYALRQTGFYRFMNWKKSIGMIGDQPIYNTKDTIKLGSINALELLCEGVDFFGML